ncbi:MAG TPA: hypothetical protein VNH44_08130 [Micropepsaceae bacterium]|nr:hypothetical protein [Micropepsaceae bacterium]
MIETRETWSQRRQRYLDYAAEAEIAASRCGDRHARDAYNELARSWTALAQELRVAANDHVEIACERPGETGPRTYPAS